ncbi:ligase-associated DNA damage response endonuclease PdeM [Rhodoligotrophos defluvii]|uniref:ligase-associated DNA damage response endonuclease PdeM n=1 Tax=Rhodoligotrophos defluvii TaxID=2561934 RepID=UPI001EF0B7DA|nr:ligase-associated DNA damage response endonuclease PdeM [Rhodoligotrophos defluvii]
MSSQPSYVQRRAAQDPSIRIDGLALVPDVSGALYAPDMRALIVADLHLEKGSSFAARGVHLPPYDTRSTLDALAAVCARLRPDTVISLGDSFHDGHARQRLDSDDIARIRRLTEAYEVVWLIGNHDRQPPDDLGGRVASELRLGPVVLRHEPSTGLALESEIAGHLHPVAAVARRGLRLRAKCFASDGRRLVMPAFGAFTGGLNVKSRAFAGVFPGDRFGVWMLGREGVYPLPSRVLLPDGI